MGRAGKLWATLASAMAIVAANAAFADEWPSRQILVVSPFVAGTTCDIVARTVLNPAGSQIGQGFVLENRPGGGGTVGVASVVKAAPDGYTLLLATSQMITAAILHKSLPYDIGRDFEPVAMFGGEPSMLMAAPGKGYARVADLVAAAKAQPGKIKFASVGVGSASYIAGERFSQMAGLDVVHVAYQGATEALADLSSGRVDFYFIPVVPALPLITQGKAVPLAVSTPNRLPSLSGLPTLKESGYPLSPYLTWCGLSAPARTPPGIIDKLNGVIAKVLELPGIRAKLLRTGYQPAPMTPQQSTSFVADDLDAMIKLAKEAHIEPLD
jgi:tripartite-type tricarboxylate transporter receptor subunit TctC